MCTQRTGASSPSAAGRGADVEVAEEVAQGQHRQIGRGRFADLHKRTASRRAAARATGPRRRIGRLACGPCRTTPKAARSPSPRGRCCSSTSTACCRCSARRWTARPARPRWSRASRTSSRAARGRLLARLAARFECVWCTGWEDRADGHLPHLLGLPAGWAHLVFADRPRSGALEAARDRRVRGPDAPPPGSTTPTTSAAGPGRRAPRPDAARHHRSGRRPRRGPRRSARAWARARRPPRTPSGRNTLAAWKRARGSRAEPRPAAPEPAGRRPAWLALLVTTRPRQWIKNLLVLAVPGRRRRARRGRHARARRSRLRRLLPRRRAARTCSTTSPTARRTAPSDQAHPPDRRRRSCAAAAIVAGVALLACAGSRSPPPWPLELVAVVAGYVAAHHGLLALAQAHGRLRHRRRRLRASSSARSPAASPSTCSSPGGS